MYKMYLVCTLLVYVSCFFLCAVKGNYESENWNFKDVFMAGYDGLMYPDPFYFTMMILNTSS